MLAQGKAVIGVHHDGGGRGELKLIKGREERAYLGVHVCGASVVPDEGGNQRHSGRPFRSTQWHSVVPGDGLLLISSGDGMGEQSRPLVAPVAPLSPAECTHRWSCRERSSERRRERSPT